jgi:hypothetical protein
VWACEEECLGRMVGYAYTPEWTGGAWRLEGQSGLERYPYVSLRYQTGCSGR